MKPWHRDVMAGAGVFCLLAAAFLVSVPLGLLVLGVALIQGAFELAPKEDNDGSGQTGAATPDIGPKPGN